MLPLLFALTVADADQHYLPPINDATYKMCREVETELLIGIERNLISSDDAHDILDRCYRKPLQLI